MSRKWIQISKNRYLRYQGEIRYSIMAGGRMHRGGEFTEWTPHSGLQPGYPDLRVEMKAGEVSRYFMFAEHEDQYMGG